MAVNKVRPSPSDSATNYKIGTKKEGNDGNIWIINKTTNGTKRWVMYKKINNTIKIKNNIVIQFKLQEQPHVVSRGTLKVDSQVSVGNLKSKKVPGFGKGLYYLYNVNDNFVLSKKKINKNKITNVLWKNTFIYVGVDTGTFGFWNYSDMVKLAMIDKKLRKKPILPMHPLLGKKAIKKSIKDNYLEVTIGDYIDSKKYEQNGFSLDKVVGYISDTYVGDGVFFLYKSKDKDMLMLMGGITTINFYERDVFLEYPEIKN